MKQEYPDRYYAQYDSTARQPTPVIGWWDMEMLSTTEGAPPLSDLLPLTEDFWQNHISGVQLSQAVDNGKIIPYKPPPSPPLPLRVQATAAMKDIQSQAPMIVAMGESFGSRMQAYVKALQAIIDGTDTASTELPAKPDNLTD